LAKRGRATASPRLNVQGASHKLESFGQRIIDFVPLGPREMIVASSADGLVRLKSPAEGRKEDVLLPARHEVTE
jgi:hypothetical protein